MAQVPQTCGDGDGVCPSWRKISLLEADNASLKRQLQVLTAEVSLIVECLGKNLGLFVVNTNSFYFNTLHGEGASAEIDNIKRSLALILPLPKANPNEDDSKLGITEKLLGQVAPINLTDHKCVEAPASLDSAAKMEKHFREDEEDVDPGDTDNQDSLDSKIVAKDSAGPESYAYPIEAGSSEIKAQLVSHSRPKNVKELATILRSDTKTDKVRKSKKSTGRPFKCQYCKKSFKRADHKKEHELIHTGQRPYNCRFCEEMFGSRSIRSKHERTHSGVSGGKYQDSENKAHDQDKGRKSANKLTATNETTKPEKAAQTPHKCRYCNTTFKHGGTRNLHERAHTGEKPHKCRFCDKTFVRSDYRNKHERIHTGEKSYICGFCDKSFRYDSNLASHLHRIHTNERAHACQLCEKTFPVLSDLRGHEKASHAIRGDSEL